MAAPASVGHLHTSIVVFDQRSSIMKDSAEEKKADIYIHTYICKAPEGKHK